MQLPLLVYSVRGGLLLVVNSALTVMWSTIMLDKHSARRGSGRCYLVVISSCGVGVGLKLRHPDGCTSACHLVFWVGGRILGVTPRALVPWELRVSFCSDEMFVLKSFHSACLRITE